MERLPNNNREIVPIERARFLDKLEPEYEERWDELLKAANETKESFDRTLFPIWLDDRFPQAIRDRVMLLSLGNRSAVVSIGGPWKNGFNGGFSSDGVVLAHRRGHDEAYTQWIDSALEYDDILDHKFLFYYAYNAFENGKWSQEKFENVLDLFDPEIVQPETYDDWRLNFSRLPYIADILANVTVNNNAAKLHEWAHEKLNLFRQNYVINESVLPKWLQDLNHITLIQFAVNECRKTNEQEQLSANIIAAFKKYGFNSHYFLDTYYRYHHLSLFNRLDELPQDVIINYATFLFENVDNGSQPRLTTEEENLLMSFINDPLPPQIITSREKYHEYIRNLENKHNKKEEEARKENYERKQKEIQRAKLTREAINRLNESMNSFRNTNND